MSSYLNSWFIERLYNPIYLTQNSEHEEVKFIVNKQCGDTVIVTSAKEVIVEGCSVCKVAVDLFLEEKFTGKDMSSYKSFVCEGRESCGTFFIKELSTFF